MILFGYLLIGFYALLTVAFLYTWWQMSSEEVATPSSQEQPFLSVLIPVRNEAMHITALLEDLQHQAYPYHRFEVIVLDDASTDATPQLVNAFASSATYALKLVQLSDKERNTSPKKRAISIGITLACGDWIVTTDGDCRVPSRWLETLAKEAMNTDFDTHLLSAPITFSIAPAAPWWQPMQIVELSSLVGAAAATMQWKMPTMCSGANLAYRKNTFIEVNGFEGNELIASGDDEFLMHKIATRYPNGVRFLKRKEAIISTQSPSSWQNFYAQRKRWASKWRHYTAWQPMAVALFIFLVNLITCWAIISGNWLLVALKFSTEAVFLATVVRFLSPKTSWWWIPLTQILYPFYVVWVALAVQVNRRFVWKGRELQ